jgi:DNA-binding response OmpR family regulator
VLQPEGYDVRTAESGITALEIIHRDLPDLIILDVMMPEMDGYEVCRRIRADKRLPYIPIIFITASELEQENVIEGFESGGDDYIRKPFDVGDLKVRIFACLRIKNCMRSWL